MDFCQVVLFSSLSDRWIPRASATYFVIQMLCSALAECIGIATCIYTKPHTLSLLCILTNKYCTSAYRHIITVLTYKCISSRIFVLENVGTWTESRRPSTRRFGSNLTFGVLNTHLRLMCMLGSNIICPNTLSYLPELDASTHAYVHSPGSTPHGTSLCM